MIVKTQLVSLFVHKLLKLGIYDMMMATRKGRNL